MTNEVNTENFRNASLRKEYAEEQGRNTRHAREMEVKQREADIKQQEADIRRDAQDLKEFQNYQDLTFKALDAFGKLLSPK